MTRRQLLVACVGLLVIAAGCVGAPDLVGGADDDGTDAPASDGSSDDGAGDGASGDGSDGSGDGVSDASDGADGGSGADQSADNGIHLVENRTTVLQEAGSYTWTWKMESRKDGQPAGGSTYTAAIDTVAERSTFGMQIGSGDDVTTDFEKYYADGMSYERYGGDGEETYNANQAEFTTQVSLFDGNTYVTRASHLEEFDRKGTETYDGVTVTRYERTDRPTYLGGQMGAEDDVRWTSFTYEVLIDGDGLVRYESWTTEGLDEDDVPISISFTYSLTGVGSTTIDEPAWVATARDEAST